MCLSERVRGMILIQEVAFLIVVSIAFPISSKLDMCTTFYVTWKKLLNMNYVFLGKEKQGQKVVHKNVS